MEVTRPLGTYSHLYWLMYLLTTAAAASLAWGLWIRVRRWRWGQGRIRDRFDRRWSRTLGLALDLASHRRFRHAPHPWIFHALLVWGCGIFLLGTICVMLQEHFRLPTFMGVWYLLLSLTLDLLAVLVLGGLVWAAWRRFVRRPEELTRFRGDGMLLLFFAAVVISGLLLEGVRMARQGDPWPLWSPVGHWISGGLSGFQMDALTSAHQGLWWGHLLLALGFLAAIPFTRLFHLFAAPAALFFNDRHASQVLIPLDFSNEETAAFGVGRIEDFHWKRLLDADACTHCGRCQVQCPAWDSGKPLSPKEVGAVLSSCLADHDRDRRIGQGGDRAASPAPLIGAVIREEALWACTTCRACEVYCPVGIEHVPRFIDMRRFLVLTEARFPAELQTTFRALERHGNPWGIARREPDAAVKLPTPADEPRPELLLWPGCAGFFDPRYRQVIAALAGLMKQAGVRFVVPGEEVVCCGDAARRLGNEYLFQDLARRNIAALKEIGIHRVVTPCPHCLNTLSNEYPQFGGHFQVRHHSVLLRDLMAEKRLPRPAPGKAPAAFHDPCYLARYAGEMAAPRELLRAVTDSPVEIPRHGEESFCCGGGGRIWLEEDAGQSVAARRIQEIVDSSLANLVTACPFCLTMLSDGAKRRGADIQISDLAEILAQNIKTSEKESSHEQHGNGGHPGVRHHPHRQEERASGDRNPG